MTAQYFDEVETKAVFYGVSQEEDLDFITVNMPVKG